MFPCSLTALQVKKHSHFIVEETEAQRTGGTGLRSFFGHTGHDVLTPTTACFPRLGQVGSHPRAGSGPPAGERDRSSGERKLTEAPDLCSHLPMPLQPLFPNPPSFLTAEGSPLLERPPLLLQQLGWHMKAYVSQMQGSWSGAAGKAAWQHGLPMLGQCLSCPPFLLPTQLLPTPCRLPVCRGAACQASCHRSC